MTAKALLEQKGKYETTLTPEELRNKIHTAVLHCIAIKAAAIEGVARYLREVRKK